MTGHAFPRPEFNPSTHGFCTKCKEVKPRQQMAKSSKRANGLHGWCKKCNQAASTAWENASPENFRKRRTLQAMSSRRLSGVTYRGDIKVRTLTPADKKARAKRDVNVVRSSDVL